ncbi:MAG: DUF1934 domain-containing protein [Clostridia bacterium]|nr:DUF1934 domain-containing protein [Clostridia bacterium]
MRLFLRSEFTSPDDPDTEVIEQELPCEVRLRGRTWFITYTEHTDGGECEVALAYNGRRLTMARRGAVKVTLGFSPKEKFSTLYTVGGMRMNMMTYTTGLSGELTDSGGEITLGYDMNVGGVPRTALLRFKFTP